jgi:hypothetical protein
LSIKGGKNKRELVEICNNNNIAITKTVEKSRKNGRGKQRGYYRFYGKGD